MDQNYLEIFKEEAIELVEELESSLLELENNFDNKDAINNAFRSLHTMKGSASMLGLDFLVNIVHSAENVMMEVREGRLQLSPEILQWGFDLQDVIMKMITEGKEKIEEQAIELKDTGESFLHVQKDLKASSKLPNQRIEDYNGPSSLYRLYYHPNQESIDQGLEPLSILRDFSQRGESILSLQWHSLPTLDEINPEEMYLQWELLLQTSDSAAELTDPFIFLNDRDVMEVEEIKIDRKSLEDQRIGEILINRGLIDENKLKQAVNPYEILGQTLLQRGLIGQEQLDSALKEQQFFKKIGQTTGSNQHVTTVRNIKVKAKQLEELTVMISNFVTLQLNLQHTAKIKNDRDFLAISERLDGLLRNLRNLSMEMHLDPVDNLFRKFNRPIRDLAMQCGKKVDLQIKGRETEIDRNLIEGLSEPLLHILRNSVDHGLETPEVRKAAGKDEVGVITLNAYYQGASFIIDVKDDGKGIDRNTLIKKARQNGLLEDGVKLKDQEILELITLPGFSTAEAVSDISGRGVGMDVVRKNVEAMRGILEIQSEKGHGTHIRIVLPANVSSTDSLLVLADNVQYLIPVNYVQECRDDYHLDQTVTVIEYRGRPIPVIDLRQLFDGSATGDNLRSIVVLDDGKDLMALAVDKVIDIHPSVFKPLNKLISSNKLLSGSDIMGDGSPAFALDITRLAELAKKERR